MKDMKEKNEFISVVVPVYNVELYLDECLDSILHQSYTDFELILVDDGSKDRSGTICDEYALKYPQIRVYHQQNQGQSAARNAGVAAAKSDWILFADSDDVIHPDMLQYMVRAVRETGANVCTCPRIESDSIPPDFSEKKPYQASGITIDETVMCRLYDEDSAAYWALFPSLIQKQIVTQHPFTPGRIYEDNALSCQWLYYARQFATVDQPFYFYRKNPNGTMQKPFSLKKLDYLWALEQQIAFFDEIGYRIMSEKVCERYIGDSIEMSRRISNELHNRKTTSAVLKNAEKMRRRHRNILHQNEILYNRVFKERHPLRYKIRKKLKRK